MFSFTEIENKAIEINDKVLQHLLEKYEGKLPFIVRRTDMNRMLEKGFWFYGEDSAIALSFWKGMDWMRKIPNISFTIDLMTTKCEFIITTTDDVEKHNKIIEFFVPNLDLKIKDEFTYSIELPTSNTYIENLDYFIENYKKKIDRIIIKQFSSRSTKIKNTIGKISFDEFKEDLVNINKYQQRKYQGSLPVTLNKLDIYQFGILENVQINNLPANCQWIFIVGENGSGKSTFLRALTFAICNGPKVSADFKQKAIDLDIGITLDKYGKKRRHRVNKLVSNELKINSDGFVAFGPTRLNIQKQIFSKVGPQDENIDSNLSNPYRPLFNSITSLIDLGFLMRVIKTDKINGLPDFNDKLRYIVEALLSICSDIVDIHVGISTEYFELIGGKKNRVEKRTFSDLSSGYKNLIAMVTHMMVQLYVQQPKINDPSQLVGLVIIDEIELHAHPKMQIEIVEKLSKIFPRIQFVVSTHSPIPMLGAKEGAIILRSCKSELGYKVKRLTKLEKELKYLTPNTIYSSDIFDFELFENLEEEDFGNLKLEDKYKDIKKNQEIEERLKKLDKSIFPDYLFDKEND